MEPPDAKMLTRAGPEMYGAPFQALYAFAGYAVIAGVVVGLVVAGARRVLGKRRRRPQQRQ